jgi:F420-0:gamma-glutamyl ligase
LRFRVIKTDAVLPGRTDISSFLDTELESLKEGSILVISSKVIALCEERAVHQGYKTEDDLVIEESEKYFKNTIGNFEYYITIAYHTLILTAGVDSSNSDGYFVPLPRDSQKSANDIRKYLVKRFGLGKVGVIVADSTSQPLRRGTIGVALSHSGFSALRDYVGTPDIFGKPLRVSLSNVLGGLTAGAVAAMGEGAEQTPLCVISDVDFVSFQDRDPTADELSYLYFSHEEDLFAPMLNGIEWKHGKKGGRQ